MSKYVLACSVAVLAAVAPSKAADWPHLRGPNYDAISSETGLADAWAPEGPPVLWTRDLGPGYAGLVVADGRAFTLFQTNGGMFVTALDADVGTELWRTRVDWLWQPGGMYPGPYASPTWHAGRVYYATPTGRVGCVAAENGRAVWSVDVRARFGSRGTEFGFASTPLVEDGRVILPVGGENAALVGLSAADGSTLWAASNEPASYCPAYPITLDGRRLVVAFLRNTLAVHDPATGAEVWQDRLSGNYDEHSAWPLFDGRHLFVASPFRAGAHVFRLTASAAGVTAVPVWSGPQLSNDVCSSLLLDGSVYGFDLHQAQASTHRPSRGVFKCVDLASGKVRWATDQVGQATPLAADGKLILWTEKGTAILARANAERYEELARAQILTSGGMCWAAPALSGKRLYARDRRCATCVYLGPPSELTVSPPTVPPPSATTELDWSKLLPREPDFPNDAPTPADVGRWFAWCVVILAVAAAATGVIRALGPRLRSGPVFGVLAFVLGAIATTALGAWADMFVLTWPVGLYVAFRGVVALGVSRSSAGWRHEVMARLVLVLFIGMCYGYYRLCLAVGYAMAWGFLAGFLPAAPFAVAAAKARRQWLRWTLDGLGFAVYFWVSGLIPGWKAAWLG